MASERCSIQESMRRVWSNSGGESSQHGTGADDHIAQLSPQYPGTDETHGKLHSIMATA